MPKRKRAERKSDCGKNDVLVKEAIESVCMRPVNANEVKEIVLTPLELQVTSLRQSVPPNTILFVACGYKAKVFGRDAHVVSRRCGVCCIPAHPFEYASCPYTRVNLYIHRLVAMGYHVVFADQESAAIRAVEKIKSKVFTRSLSRIYSRGTLLPDEDVGGTGGESSTGGASLEECKIQNSYNRKPQNNYNNNEAIDDSEFDGEDEETDVLGHGNEHDNGVLFKFTSCSDENKHSHVSGDHNLYQNNNIVEVIIESSKNYNTKKSTNNEMENDIAESNKTKLLAKTINWDEDSTADTNANHNNKLNTCYTNFDSAAAAAASNDSLSELFICFISCTQVDIDLSHQEHSELEHTTRVQVILVDFVTRQRISVSVTTALEFDDLLSQHEIVEFVVLLRTALSSSSSLTRKEVELACTSNCCSSKKAEKEIENQNDCLFVEEEKDMSNQNFSFHLTYRSTEGYCYKPAKYYLNSLPSYVRKTLESNYRLNYGPTCTGEEDNSGNISFNGFTCSHEENWDEFVQSYLKSYGFGDVYEEICQSGKGEGEMESCKTCSTSSTKHTTSSHEPNSINTQQAISTSDISQMHTMSLPGNTIRALDVFPSAQRDVRETAAIEMDECANNNSGTYTTNSNYHYSLFNLLDYSLTACGKRLLHRWIASPLTCLDDIHARQVAVTFLVNHYCTNNVHRFDKFTKVSVGTLNEQNGRPYTHLETEAVVVVRVISSLLLSTRQVGDVEGVLSKMQAGRCTVREFVRLLQLVQLIYQLIDEIPEFINDKNSLEPTSNIQIDVTDNDNNDNNTIDDRCQMAHLPELIKRQLHACHSTPVRELIMKYDNVIQKNPSCALEFFLSNVHVISDALHEQIQARQQAQERLERELVHIRRQVHLPELEYRTIGGTPFVIDLPLSHSHKVPRDWMVLTRTKSHIRFHTEEIVHAYTALSAANARATALSISDWTQYQHEFVSYQSKTNLHILSGVIQSVSVLDALQCLAKASSRAGYVRPILINNTIYLTTALHVNLHQTETKNSTNKSPICKEVIMEAKNQAEDTSSTITNINNSTTWSCSSDDQNNMDKDTFTSGDSDSGAFINIEHGRHPLMDVLLQHRYVASSLSMPVHGGWILTGPNMGGKSALMRMLGLFVILAQIGCYVPARRATLPLFTAIHCRMGASDAILEGSSTFLNEMNETARILRSPNLNTSLVLMDELGRGTSSFDGAAVASATLNYLLQQRTTFLFVTHFNYICEEYNTFNKNKEQICTGVSIKEMNETNNSSQVSLTHSREQHNSAAALSSNNNDSRSTKMQENIVECYYMGFRKRMTQWQEKTTTQPTQEEQSIEQPLSRSSIIFTYQPEKGITPSSFGVDVAAMAGLPASLLTEAHILSTTAEKLQQYRSSLHCIKCFMK